MKTLFLNLIAIASTCCCVFNGACKKSQSTTKNSQNVAIEHLEPKIKMAASTAEFTDNGHKDNKWTGANNIAATTCRISAKLNTNNWWDRLWNGVSEIDTDWYCFHLESTKRFKFNFDSPNSGYSLSLYKYGQKEPTLIKTVYGEDIIASRILQPATYYLKVTADKASNVKSNQWYEVQVKDLGYSIDSNTFDLTPAGRSYFKMAIWENDMNPMNMIRGTTNNYQEICCVDRHMNKWDDDWFVDPIYQSPYNAKYLDSIIYVWGKDFLKAFHNVLDELNEQILDRLTNNKIKGAKVSYREDRQSFYLDLIGLIPGVGEVVNAFQLSVDGCNALCGVINTLTNRFNISTYEYSLGLFIGQLLGVTADMDSTPDRVLSIPRFARVVVERRSEGAAEHLIETFYKERYFNETDMFVDGSNHCIYIKDKVYKTVDIIDSAGTKIKTSHGDIKLFDNLSQFNTYFSVL